MQSPTGKLIQYNKFEDQDSAYGSVSPQKLDQRPKNQYIPNQFEEEGSTNEVHPVLSQKLQQINNQYKKGPQVPEYFQIGGNKTLNMQLFNLRKQKISNMKDPIIQCETLGKMYQLKNQMPVQALKNITLTGEGLYGAIKKGEFVTIRGPSGGGKTTFLNMLGTIDSATSGSLKIENHLITTNSSDAELSKLRRQKIGIVFQTFNLLALMSAYENIQLPMRIKGQMSEKAMKQRTKMLLKRVGLAQRADHLPSQLSGGEQQRVAIARSLANSPSIILLDEPTGDLDSKSTVNVMNLLLQINNFGYTAQATDPITIVMVTHNEDLECYADRIIFFEDGKINHQVLNQYQFALDAEEYAQFLNTKI